MHSGQVLDVVFIPDTHAGGSCWGKSYKRLGKRVHMKQASEPTACYTQRAERAESTREQSSLVLE